MGSIPGYHIGDDPTENSDDITWNSTGEPFLIDRGAITPNDGHAEAPMRRPSTSRPSWSSHHTFGAAHRGGIAKPPRHYGMRSFRTTGRKPEHQIQPWRAPSIGQPPPLTSQSAIFHATGRSLRQGAYPRSRMSRPQRGPKRINPPSIRIRFAAHYNFIRCCCSKVPRHARCPNSIAATY